MGIFGVIGGARLPAGAPRGMAGTAKPGAKPGAKGSKGQKRAESHPTFRLAPWCMADLELLGLTEADAASEALVTILASQL